MNHINIPKQRGTYVKRVILDDRLRVESYDIIDLTKPVSFLYEKKIGEVFSGFIDHCNII